MEGLEDTCCIAFAGSKAVAFSVCFTTTVPHTIRIFGFTRPREQNNGLGTYLLNQTEQYAKENKIKSLLNGFINISIENFDEGSFPRKLSLVINKKK